MSNPEEFIDGIYNYCDRWCERCALTQRCRVFAVEEQSLGRGDLRDRDKAAFWRALESVLTQTIDMLQEVVQEDGPAAEAPRADLAETCRRHRRALAHPLVLRGHAYAQEVGAWFEQKREPMEALKEALGEEARFGSSGLDAEREDREIGEAVEVARWYQFQIPIKLARAVSARQEGRDGPSFEADGSAKVALLAIDRSLAAWTLLRAALPDEDDSVLDLLVLLGALRRDTERDFPRARVFVRPGFDDCPAPSRDLVG
jgi:hypothetical protein